MSYEMTTTLLHGHVSVMFIPTSHKHDSIMLITCRGEGHFGSVIR